MIWNALRLPPPPPAGMATISRRLCHHVKPHAQEQEASEASYYAKPAKRINQEFHYLKHIGSCRDWIGQESNPRSPARTADISGVRRHCRTWNSGPAVDGSTLLPRCDGG